MDPIFVLKFLTGAYFDFEIGMDPVEGNSILKLGWTLWTPFFVLKFGLGHRVSGTRK